MNKGRSKQEMISDADQPSTSQCIQATTNPFRTQRQGFDCTSHKALGCYKKVPKYQNRLEHKPWQDLEQKRVACEEVSQHRLALPVSRGSMVKAIYIANTGKKESSM
jgi:hypothetical protein